MENRGYSRKTIKSVLNKKVDTFIKSIEDTKLQKLVKDNTIITGGAIASMLLGEKINDFDLYFTNKETVIKVSEYYVQKFIEKHDAPKDSVLVLHSDTNIVKEVLSINKEDVSFLNTASPSVLELEECEEEIIDVPSHLYSLSKKFKLSFRLINSIYETFTHDINRVKIFFTGSWGAKGDKDESFENEVSDILGEDIIEEEKPKFSVSFISANAITLTDKIQLVIRFYGDAAEIHSNYDFMHVTNYWTSKDNNLVTNTNALECLMSKRLVYQGSKYPLASIFRAKKFITRGWNINAGQYLKMAFQLNDLDLKDPYTLEEQLTGVDLLYFAQIIQDLREKQSEKDFTATTEYFLEIISRMFD